MPWKSCLYWWRMLHHKNGSDAAGGLFAVHTPGCCLMWYSTPIQHGLWRSLASWRLHGQRPEAMDKLKINLEMYLDQSVEDAWDDLANNLRWTTLHRHVYDLATCALSPVPIGTPLRLPSPMAVHINTRNSLGLTPIFYAMLNGQSALESLLQAGADPRMVRSMMVSAAMTGASGVIGVLVRAGVDVNTCDEGRYTALHWTAQLDSRYCSNGLLVALELMRHAGHLLDWDAQDCSGWKPLVRVQFKAVKEPDNEYAQRMLWMYQAHIIPDGAQYAFWNAEDDGQGNEDDDTGLPTDSLIQAGLSGDVSAISDLISRDTMVNERDGARHTLLRLVALGRVQNGYRVALELVRYDGWGIDWKVTTEKGRTALELAEEQLHD